MYPVSIEQLEEKYESLVRARSQLRMRYVTNDVRKAEFDEEITRVDELIERTKIHIEFLKIVLKD